MSTSTSFGTILWQDLTVENAEEVSRFYTEVIGWKASPHDMGEYHDYDMQGDDGKTIAGICHAKGPNANLPAQWLIYINVKDVEKSAAKCREHGGEVLDGPRMMGGSKFCAIRDPGGAVLALVSD
ncbi:MAG: VOC family protein [Chlorobi bacterium]|nr:VOC family protein [Chlorobiota bacterium]